MTSLTAQNVETPDMQSTVSRWNLDFISHEVSYTDRLALNEGEEFFLPTYRGFKIDGHVALIRTTSEE